MNETTKTCTRCVVDQPISGFNRRAASRDGHQACCKACERIAKRSHYVRNREAILAEMRARNAADPTRNRQKARAWAQRNPTRSKERSRQWRDANRDLVREWGKAFARRYPDRVRANTTIQRAKRRGAPRVPFTAAQLTLRMSIFPGCWICGGPKQTIDHVKPLAKGGTHMLGNLRPACIPCNCSKQDTWPFVRPAA